MPNEQCIVRMVEDVSALKSEQRATTKSIEDIQECMLKLTEKVEAIQTQSEVWKGQLAVIAALISILSLAWQMWHG